MNRDYKRENKKYSEIKDSLVYARDVYEGTTNIKKNYNLYLQRWQLENDSAYFNRSLHIRFFNYFKPAVAKLATKVLKDGANVKLTNGGTALKKWLDNVDLKENGLDSFLFTATKSAIKYGKSFIYVDMEGDKPFLKVIERIDLINYSVNTDGSYKLAVFKLEIEVEDETNMFNTDFVEAHCVLYPGGGYVIYNGQKIREWETDTTFIPFFEISADTTAGVPLIDLIHENLSHMNKLSSLDYTLITAGVPIPVLTINAHSDEDNLDKNILTLGGVNAIVLEDKTLEDFKYVELEGKTIPNMMDNINKSEEYMRSFTGISTKTNVATATEANIVEKDVGIMLTDTANSLNSTVLILLTYVGELLRDNCNIEVSINNDFDSVVYDANMVIALSKMQSVGQLSKDELWEELKGAKVLRPFDNETMRKAIKKEEKEALDMFEQGADEITKNKNKAVDFHNKAGI